MNTTVLKFVQVLVIVLVAVGLDQWTKQIASDRLATERGRSFSHFVYLTVPDDFDGKTAEEYLRHEFVPPNSEEELQRIMESTTTDMAVRVRPGDTVEAGDKLEVRWREIEVIPGYWDYQYTRNPGAAFSFLADADSSFRKPFFIGVSALAVVIIFWILVGVKLRQQLLIWSLSLVCSGAIGNLIDRVRFEYVIDFIVWKYTDAYRWPTFNLADAFICIGVGLMVIEMIRDWKTSRDEDPEASAEA